MFDSIFSKINTKIHIQNYIMAAKKNPEKVCEECMKILKNQSGESILKWLNEHKLTSFILRNEKASQVVSISNYMFQKMFINQNHSSENELLNYLIQYHKMNYSKCYQYTRLVKHFSQWDYEFEFIYSIAIDSFKEDIGLYLRCRQSIMKSDFNKSKKELLSGVIAELEDWANIARYIFKDDAEEDIVDRYTKVVKNHFVHVKKSQSQRLNGAEFFKVCQIISGSVKMEEGNYSQKHGNTNQMANEQKIIRRKEDEKDKMIKLFDESLLSGLTSQDRELIRILSYKDKNIARMLQQKHTKMVHIIGQQVDKLRTDINIERERYIEVVEEKKALLKYAEKMKETALKFILEKNEVNEFDMLTMLDNFNKKYNPKAVDVNKVADVINNRRLIQIIQKEELEDD